MKTSKLSTAAALGLSLTLGACMDLETTVDPNRPTTASPNLLFVGVQTAMASFYGSDLSRLSAMFVQQAIGLTSQYIPIYEYGITENTTNGQQNMFYIQGGLVDVRRLQAQVRELGDSNYLGIAQVQEALMMSLEADVYGDIVYREALQGGNPNLDPQMQVYGDLQLLLDTAISNLNNTTAPANSSPGAADLVYGGDRLKWRALAYSLKARIYMNMAEVNPAAYELARVAALSGIRDPDDDYVSIYSGNGGEANLLFQFIVEQRAGQIGVNQFFFNLIENHPRYADFLEGGSTDFTYSSTEFAAKTSPQPIMTADETILISAETEWRRNQYPNARTFLDEYGALHGIPAVPAGLVGQPLLNRILTEKYIALFHQIQAWSDYKRTCFPNLVPVTTGMDVPARLFYDANERSTNPNIPDPNSQPARNANDPPNATSDGNAGAACLGQ